MLARRLCRWPNIKPTLFQCVMFAGISLCAVNPFSAGTDFRRQILTSNVRPRTERVKRNNPFVLLIYINIFQHLNGQWVPLDPYWDTISLLAQC